MDKPKSLTTGTGSATSSRGISAPVGRPPSPPDTPRMPNMQDRAQELLNHISSLERENSVLRGSLFGEGAQEANGPDASAGPWTIEGMLSQACTRVACMVGDMATINGKVSQ